MKGLLAPRTWNVRCPSCHGCPTRIKGCWSATSRPVVVWTCSTCKGTSEVAVELARPEDGQ